MVKNYAGMALGKPGASTGSSEHATPAALPAPPVGSKDFYEKVNPYWLDQAARRPRFSCTIQATSSKRQAASGAGGPVSGKFLIDKK
tara:strand:+ start:850 stop:1110 length:261 start_codon:yes stop_codon:yes gene_type:complete